MHKQLKNNNKSQSVQLITEYLCSSFKLPQVLSCKPGITENFLEETSKTIQQMILAGT
jgi:hypothetical protein